MTPTTALTPALRTLPRSGPPRSGPSTPGSARPGRHAAPPFSPVDALRRLVRGRPADPRWVRPALLGLLAATALLYLWDLGASGTANTYYAAAVQAGTQSLKAWLFGSLDSSNFITVDKPPAALWVMVLSARVFGFSSWSLLAPQALMGVASVGLTYATVRRWAGARAGLLAGAVLATTPAAVLMFRFDNPDALLVLCLVAAAYAVVRAVDATRDRAATWWMVAAGALVGLGFLTKMMQAFLVLPALAAVFLLAAAGPLRRRLLALAAGAAAMVASVAWYVLLVDLWPTDSRPYIGGSTDNTFLDLVLGYNGLGRLLGGEGNGGGGSGGGAGGGGGGGGGGGFGGSAGITRMFNSEFGGQASWLLPASLIVLVAGLWCTRRAPRTDRTRAALVLGGLWTLVTALVFSFMSGTIHAYYVIALAPGIAITLAVGVRVLWQRRDRVAARLTLATTLAATAGWSVVLLRRTPEFLPWLRWVVAVAGVVAVIAALLPATSWRGGARRVVPVVLLAALLAGAGASTAYAAQTALTAHQGSIVSAGPSTGDGGPGAGPGGGGPGGGGPGGGGPGGGAPGGAPGDGGAPPSSQAGGGSGGSGGGAGGGPGGSSTSAELTSLLTSAGTRWSAATVSAQSASGMQLASGTAVMAIGGFSGSDDAPSLEQFQAWVASGDVHYFVAGTGAGGPGGGSDSVGTRIQEWVAAHYTATTVDGTTVYDLTAPTG